WIERHSARTPKINLKDLKVRKVGLPPLCSSIPCAISAATLFPRFSAHQLRFLVDGRARACFVAFLFRRCRGLQAWRGFVKREKFELHFRFRLVEAATANASGAAKHSPDFFCR